MAAENIVIQQESVPSVTEKHKEEEDGETKSIIVEGLALPFNEESRNGVVYTKESIKETANQMVGCSVLWNHDDSIPSLGRVVDTEIRENYSEGKDGLYYKMELDTQGELESKVARKLEKGYINNVSIQAAVDDEGLEAPKVAVKDWYELTICNIAGFPQTTTDTSEQTVNGEPEKVKLNGRVNMTEMALAESLNESLDDDGDDSQDNEGDGEENFAGLSDDIADRAEELVNEDNDLSFKESVLQAIEEADGSQDGSDGENENSNKNGDNESNSMSGDNSDSGDGDTSQEQSDDIEEMVEQMQETVNELADRVESVEEQVASMSEADEGDDKNQDDGEEGEGTSKQGFDPDDAQDAAESTRNQIAESLRETK